MNYAKEKEIVEAQVKRWKKIVLYCVVFVLLCLSIFGAFVPPETWKYYFSIPKIEARAEGDCRVHFLSVGQGDCTIIEFPDGKTAMIDGGSANDKTTAMVMRYLNALKIDTIENLIVTHADADHCGSLASIVKYKKVQKAFLPTTTPTVIEIYASFYAMLVKKEVEVLPAIRTTKLMQSESCHFSFLYPYSIEEENTSAEENNQNSSVAWLDYQGTSVLFSGDMPMQTENILMRDSILGLFSNMSVCLAETEILKVSHHGSREQTSDEFLEYIHAKDAVISCGEGNDYGHPHEELLDRLHTHEIAVHRTDKDGGLVLTIKPSGEYAFTALGLEY